jgi:CheY-like chemotaxis protein
MLGIILGHADLADLNLPEGSPERNNLEEIRRACLRAREMVKQILTFSRKGEHDVKPLSLSPVVRESLTLLRASIPTTIEIRQEISEGAGAVVGDATQINQILINLCANAAHAMRERGGVLEIRLENVEVDEQTAARIHDLEAGPYVKLTIGDTGHGMSSDIMDRIFDPYFTTKGVGEGSGMGLAVVHGIVNAHGGGIAVESSPGRGTRVDVFFPRYQGPVGLDGKAAEIVPGGHERILLVDDEEALLKIERAMLSQLGYTVDATKDSLEALETFRAQPALFDAVITDQTMPRMTGETLAREILSLRSEIPVILCTGFSELINEEQAKAMGIREYMTKPLVMSELARTLRRVLDEAGR